MWGLLFWDVNRKDLAIAKASIIRAGNQQSINELCSCFSLYSSFSLVLCPPKMAHYQALTSKLDDDGENSDRELTKAFYHADDGTEGVGLGK